MQISNNINIFYKYLALGRTKLITLVKTVDSVEVN